MPHALLTESLVVILAAAGAVGLVKRIGFPPILGYLLAGLAIGPHGLEVLAPSEGTAFLSELGVVLLMFMVGLEFSLPKMIAARATVFGAGACQVALTTLSVAFVARLFGAGWPAAIVMGSVVAMSSTAITLKQLSDEGDLGSAPDLAGWGSKDWLVRFITDPTHEAFYRDTNDRMPAFGQGNAESTKKPLLAAEDIDLLARYLRGEL